MKRTMALLVTTSFLVVGCGSDDDGGGGPQNELADLLLAEDVAGVDGECLRDKTAELSDDEAEFLIDNIDSTDTDTFSSDLQAWVDGLIDCLDLDAQDS